MFRNTLTEWLLGSREARRKFRSNVVAPPRAPRPFMRVMPPISAVVVPGDVGRAYDHWCRVVCIIKNRLGAQKFREFRAFHVYREAKYSAQPGFSKAVIECLRALERCYESRNFLNRALLRSVFILGYFEREYRTGQPIFHGELNVNEDSIVELAKLAKASDTSWMVGKVVLNPVFGLKGPKGVLAADGDLIVNDTLYELKSGRELRPLETLRQLLGYAVMNSFLPSGHAITAVGYYYVRFNHRKRFQLSELCTQEQFAALQKYLGGKLGKKVPRL